MHRLIRGAGIRMGVDPLGGASLAYWPIVAETFGLDLQVVNPASDPRFAFMTVDHDGKTERQPGADPGDGLIRGSGSIRSAIVSIWPNIMVQVDRPPS